MYPLRWIVLPKMVLRVLGRVYILGTTPDLAKTTCRLWKFCVDQHSPINMNNWNSFLTDFVSLIKNGFGYDVSVIK